MPRFFTHLVDGMDVLLDPEGVERAADTIVQATLVQARDLMAGDVKRGQLDLGYHLEVHDEHGQVVHVLTFPEAVTVVRQPPVNSGLI